MSNTPKSPVAVSLDGTTFVISVIPARKAPKAFKQLVRVAAPLMSEIVKVLGDGDIAKLDMKDAVVSGKLEGLVERATEIDDEALLALMMTLAEHTVVEGTSLDKGFDLVFTGRLDVMVKWFVEAVKVNFGSFFASTAAPKT